MYVATAYSNLDTFTGKLEILQMMNREWEEVESQSFTIMILLDLFN